MIPWFLAKAQAEAKIHSPAQSQEGSDNHAGVAEQASEQIQVAIAPRIREHPRGPYMHHEPSIRAMAMAADEFGPTSGNCYPAFQ